MPDSPRRQNGHVWIEGVPPLLWDMGKDCTFAAAMESATAPTEHPWSYTDIMGRTGLAFRVRWTNDETVTSWDPSNGIGEMPDEQQLVRDLVGWQLEVEQQFGDGDPDTDAIMQRVAASIDEGLPVLAYATTYDVAVIYGYGENGATLLVREYSREGSAVELPAADVGPLQMYLVDYSNPPGDKEATLEAIAVGVRNWRRERHDGGIAGREYWYGEAAFAAWIDDLDNMGDAPLEEAEVVRSLDVLNHGTLVDARAAAAAFLMDAEDVIGRRTAEHVHRAARLYQEEVRLLRSETTRAWTAEDIRKWSPDVRKSEVNALTSALQIERDAMKILEEVLEIESVEV